LTAPLPPDDAGAPRPARLSERLFQWTAQPAGAAVLAVGLAMTLAALVAVEALVPRQTTGSALDARIGWYAVIGTLSAAGLTALAALLRRTPGMRAQESDDADQP